MNHFLTKDLYISSYLISSGCPLVTHAQVDGVTMFSFARTDKLDELVESYFSLRALVNPVKYDEAIKSLRHLTMGPKQKNLSSLVAM